MNKWITILALLLISSCQKKEESYIPDRPSNLPDSAVWRGGIDGGWWTDCEAEEASFLCFVYWQDGDLYSQQRFNLCATDNITEWFGFPDGEGSKAVPAFGAPFSFIPIEPATFYDDGQADKAATDKYAKIFSETIFPTCATEIGVSQITN